MTRIERIAREICMANLMPTCRSKSVAKRLSTLTCDEYIPEAKAALTELLQMDLSEESKEVIRGIVDE